MTKIFLCYRRQDSAGVAGRIYDRLRVHFGDDAVFMDTRNIPIGVNFRNHIDSAIGQCDVVLAVIGRKWAGEDDAHRRVDDPKDFIRIEIESALKRDIPVIPILIDRTRMPTEAELPPSLAKLAFRNAIALDQGRDFHRDVDVLVKGIEFHFERRKNAVAGPLSHSSEGVPDVAETKAPERRRITHPTKRAQLSKSAPETEHRTNSSAGASGSALRSKRVAHDVFISFSTTDKAIADSVCAILEAEGIRCWIAPRDVQSGIPYPQSIMEGIRGSRVLVLVASR